jgi:hypothetical protein
MQSFADVVGAARSATAQEKEELRQVLGWEQPSTKIRDYLWKVIVWAMVIILVGTFGVIALGVLFNVAAKPELLTMFTAALGFLAGLLAPSPVKKDAA